MILLLGNPCESGAVRTRRRAAAASATREKGGAREKCNSGGSRRHESAVTAGGIPKRRVGLGAVSVVETAQRIADDVLFPAALATDAADAVPVELLDQLATAGLYALGGVDFPTVCSVAGSLP